MKETIKKIILFAIIAVLIFRFYPGSSKKDRVDESASGNVPTLQPEGSTASESSGSQETEISELPNPEIAEDTSAPASFADITFDGQTYEGSVNTGLGNMVYYNQHDSRWANYLWGGSDPLTTFGCGPTALAMIVASFTDNPVTPPDMAKWADDNNFRSPGLGSKHNLIPETLNAFGLEAQSQYVLTPEAISSTLNFGKIMVALMGPGHFTEGGHFIILTGTTPDGQITVADPQSYENTMVSWDPALILSEVKACDFGGPIWAISKRQ